MPPAHPGRLSGLLATWSSVKAMVPGKDVLPFCADGRWLAVEAEHVVEILGSTVPTPIAASSAAIVGLVSWRGRAICAVQLGTAARPAAPARLVVVRVGDSVFALCA